MLLVLLNFPTSMGNVSKPNGGKGPQTGDWANTEPFVFPFWWGPQGGLPTLSFTPLLASVTPQAPYFIPA